MIIDKYGRQWTQDGDAYVSGGLRVGGLTGARLHSAMNALYPGTPPAETADDREAGAKAALAGIGANVDRDKLLQAIVINFTARALGKAPAQLTAADLDAEQTRIARIYKVL